MELWKRRQSTAAMKWGVEGDIFIIHNYIMCFIIYTMCSLFHVIICNISFMYMYMYMYKYINLYIY
jgi:hypothetical protein